MSNELKQIIEVANNLIKAADVGREFTMNYVIQRFETALDEYPHDPIIKSMAQVIHKQAKNGKVSTSQKELYQTYNHFAGLSSTSAIKDILGDLLKTADFVATTKIDETGIEKHPVSDVDLVITDNPLSTLFDKNVSGGLYFDPALAKIGKYKVLEELDAIGVPANEVRVFGGNEQSIIYDAMFTNKLGTTHVAIPVELNNGISSPIYFYNRGQFVDLNADNLNSYIISMATTTPEINDVGIKDGIRTATSSILPSFNFDTTQELKLDRPEMPEVLKDLASFENAVIDASTSFSSEVVKAAKSICMRELGFMGLRSQVSLGEATDNCIICRAELDSASGKVEIKLPVEVINNRPQIPSLFYNELEKDKIYDFNKGEVVAYLTSAKPDNGRIMRYSNDFFNMTYNQLKEEIIAGVVNKDYSRAEQALNRIEDKFGADQHLKALSEYSIYLTQTSKIAEIPKNKCRLLIVKGSIEPRCGHYNVPISQVSTNEKGNCTLTERQAKYDNLAESTSALIRSNKIVLT